MTAPPPAGVNLAHRRWIGRLIRLGLVVVTFLVVAAWWGLKRSQPRDDVRIERRGADIGVQRQAPSSEALGPGDIDLILKGDQILAGLSPQKVAEIRAQLDRKVNTGDSSGLGAMIAQTVKNTVAENIGAHAVWQVADIRDIRIENDEIVIEDWNGNKSKLFSNTKVNDEPLSRKFVRSDAERFVEAVRARMKSRP
jgi:hypothetical protein